MRILLQLVQIWMALHHVQLDRKASYGCIVDAILYKKKINDTTE